MLVFLQELFTIIKVPQHPKLFQWLFIFFNKFFHPLFLLLLCEVFFLSTRCRINDCFCEARLADCVYIPWCYLSHNTTTDMMVSFKLCVTETPITLRHVIYHNRYKASGATTFLFKNKGSMYIIVFLTPSHTQPAARRSEPSMSFLLILAFCQ